MPDETISKALILINLHKGSDALRVWINSNFTEPDIQKDLFQRFGTVMGEFIEESGISTEEFLSIVKNISHEAYMNIRILRSKVREAMKEHADE